METLALIEALDRDGQPRQLLRVTQWPVRIGRAIDCDLVLDDPHVAAHHATLFLREDAVHVEPASTLNGVRLGSAVVAPSSTPALPPSRLLQVGATTLRVRLAGDALPPEQRFVDLHVQDRRQALGLAALIVGAALWHGFDQWLTTIPGTPGYSLAWSYLSLPAGLVLWCLVWAIGSMLFQHRFAFWPHLRVALAWLLAGTFARVIAGQLAFALSAPLVDKAGQLLFAGATAMMIWRQLELVLPRLRRSFGIAVASAVVVGGGLTLVARSMQQQPLVGDLYLGTISLPGVRIARPVSVDAFVKSAAALEPTLQRWAKPGDGDEDDGDGD